MRIIPLRSVPYQEVAVVLNGQACLIWVYQQSTGLFVDLKKNGNPIVYGVIGQDNNRIVRDTYLGFDGDLIFIDTQGTEDPTYQNLGSRFFLAYLTAAEVNSLVLVGQL